MVNDVRAGRLLSQPFGLGRATMANRIVMAPMARRKSPDGAPGEDVAVHAAGRLIEAAPYDSSALATRLGPTPEPSGGESLGASPSHRENSPQGSAV